MKTYYTIYKITNKINGKIYIGSHKTENLDDNYMGSGKYLNYAQRKHGIENFEKEILFVFNNPEEMYAKEKEIVNEEFLAEEHTYNIKIGGFGGWDHINNDIDKRKEKNRNARASTNKILKEKYGDDWASIIGKMGAVASHTKEAKEKRARTKIKNKIISDASYMNTPEVREKVKQRFKEIKHQQGEKNSQYGLMWITNEETNLKIKKTDSIPEGYRKGRIMRS